LCFAPEKKGLPMTQKGGKFSFACFYGAREGELSLFFAFSNDRKGKTSTRLFEKERGLPPSSFRGGKEIASCKKKTRRKNDGYLFH